MQPGHSREVVVNTFPGVLLVLRWQVGDTFRQSLATQTFWLLLTVTGVSILDPQPTSFVPRAIRYVHVSTETVSLDEISQ
jgi:hypothetical protein